VLLERRIGARNPGQIDEWKIGPGQIAGDDVAAGVVLLPLLDELRGKRARDGLLTARAG